MGDVNFGSKLSNPFVNDNNYNFGLPSPSVFKSNQPDLLPENNSNLNSSIKLTNLYSSDTMTVYPLLSNSPSFDEIKSGAKHLELGDTGSSVIELQQKLNIVREKYHQIPIPVTGTYDINTHDAVKDFHPHHDFDSTTLKALDKELASPEPLDKWKAVSMNILHFFGVMGTTFQGNNVSHNNYPVAKTQTVGNNTQRSTFGRSLSSISTAITSGANGFVAFSKNFANQTIQTGKKVAQRIKEAILPTNYTQTDGRKVKLKEEYHPLLDNLTKSIKSKGYTIGFNSSYRDNAEQAQLYKKAVRKYGAAEAGKWVAPSGRSKHNSGLALDMNIYDKRGKMIPQREFDKIISQAGFYRPMSWETWHIEPLSTKNSRA